MKIKRLMIRTGMAMVLSLGLPLALLWLLSSGNAPVTAAPAGQPLRAPGSVITVCLTGGCDFSSIQDAVNTASASDEIRVASGTYTSVNDYGGLAQVVYISKTVTIRGGYTTTNWTTSYPITQPTILDAQGQGRVLYITGDISPVIEGFHITGGDATGLRGGEGGGLYLWHSGATFSGNNIFSNTASSGGGLYLYGSDNAILSANTISNNDAAEGGGLYLAFSKAVLSGNTVASNVASMAGGFRLWSSDATLNNNVVFSNTAIGSGGGLHLGQSNATLNGNLITNNAASRGGGLCLASSNATLTNNLVAYNRANSQGSGLYIECASPRLLHNTIARNTGGNGSGVYVTDNGSEYSIVALTNTILVNHTVAIVVTAGNTATLDSTLWHANTTDWSGNVKHARDHSDDPAFDTDGCHLTTDSAAIDIGVDAGVTVDIDGEPRPAGTGYEIGADEFQSIPDAPITGLKAANDSPTLLGQVTTLMATVTTGSNVVYTWAFGDGVTDSGAVVTYIYAAPGAYTAIVTANNSVNTLTATTTVTVTDVPITGLIAVSDAPTVLGRPTTLTATITAGSHVAYIWAFGDGYSARGAIVTHTYPAVGIYTAVITATNSVNLVAATTTATVTSVLHLPLVMKRWPPVPYQPVLYSISNADGDGDYHVAWTEQPSRLADIYTLEEATDAAFTIGFRTVCTTAEQSCAVSGRLAGRYYYRVQGYNSWGHSGYSSVEAATVLLPDTPTLNAIDNADGDGSYSVTWSAAARATSYTLQEDTDSAFGSPATVYDDVGQSWSATGRSPGTYHYRVRANGPTGQSGWSNIRTAIVTPPPSDVLVTTSRAFYHTPYGTTYLYVVGVLLNNTSSNQHIDDIVVTFYNAQDAIVGVWSPYPEAYTMSPGQRAPFKDYDSDIPVGWTRYTVEVHHNSTTRRPYSFAFSNINHYHDTFDCLHIVGRITNTDSRATAFLEVYATLFDTQDNVVNCGGTYPADLDPGESTTFDISICESTTGWTHFELGADSLVW